MERQECIELNKIKKRYKKECEDILSGRANSWGENVYYFNSDNSFHPFGYYETHPIGKVIEIPLRRDKISYKVSFTQYDEFRIRFRYIKDPFTIYQGEDNSFNCPMDSLVREAFNNLLRSVYNGKNERI